MTLFRTKPPGNIDQEGNVARTLTESELQEKLKQIREKEETIALAKGLPFLFGWKWYPWAKEFYNCRERIAILTAANQISKSSTQIRTAINWATDQRLWPALWAHTPNQFWYLYPTQTQVNIEFETKWTQFLPKNGFENHPVYGYTVERKQGDVRAIHFKSGVHIYFKTYGQNVIALQSGTCDAVFCDEELPEDLFDELMFRLSASDGYFRMVFTATLGQDFWRRTMEPTKNDEENLPGAWKRTVSLYDAMVYEDGTPSHWTADKIAQVRGRCSTQQEVLKRIYGKFIVLGGRKYPAFDITKHMVKKHPLPHGWYYYGGVDPGSGGETGHPAAICFVAVRPDFRAGRVMAAWRGDGITTTAGTVVEKYIEMKTALKIKTVNQFYDWSSKDFYNISLSMREPFEKAEKGHEIGEDVINTLFNSDMMLIYEDEETAKLAGELSSLLKTTLKRDAKDNASDAFRYAITKIPWDFSGITGHKSEFAETPEAPMNDMERQIYERRKAFDDEDKKLANSIQEEFDELNAEYGSDY